MARVKISASGHIPRHKVVERIAHISATETAAREKRAKEASLQQLAKTAAAKGGNALINVHYEPTKELFHGYEVTCRGTAAKVKRK